MTMTEEEHALEAERQAEERRRMVQVVAEHATSAVDLVSLVELLGLEEELEELRLKRTRAGNPSDESTA
jgi:hypothetical protein